MDENDPLSVVPAPDPPIADNDPELLLTFLRNRDTPCPLCGYNLRDLTSPQCPECGQILHLAVGLAQPFPHYWVITAICTFASAAFGMIFLAQVIRFHGLLGTEFSMTRVVAIYFMGNIPLALTTLFFRRRFLKLARGRQMSLSSVILFLTVAALVMLLIEVLS